MDCLQLLSKNNQTKTVLVSLVFTKFSIISKQIIELYLNNRLENSLKLNKIEVKSKNSFQ